MNCVRLSAVALPRDRKTTLLQKRFVSSHARSMQPQFLFMHPRGVLRVTTKKRVFEQDNRVDFRVEAWVLIKELVGPNK